MLLSKILACQSTNLMISIVFQIPAKRNVINRIQSIFNESKTNAQKNISI
jgi:hypothetical protein